MQNRRIASLLFAVAALVGLTTTGVAAHDPATEADREVRAGALVGPAECGVGHQGYRSAALDATMCWHSSPDLPSSVLAAAPGAPSSKPRCYGNGVNGPRVQLVYVYRTGQPNRAAEVVPKILNDWVLHVEGVFRATSREQGRELGVRFHMPSCKPTVDTVQLDVTSTDTSERISEIVEGLAARGFSSVQRKYLIWFDGSSYGALCGVAIDSGLSRTPGFYDNPTPVNPYNVGPSEAGGVVLTAGYAIAYRQSSSEAFRSENCWGGGALGALTETHELLHTLGAVQASAPNSDGIAHCVDANDIMCDRSFVGSKVYPKLKMRCSAPIELLDCGQDDYFSARPATGGYLSTHWNIANSWFLGPQSPWDEVPVDLPRP